MLWALGQFKGEAKPAIFAIAPYLEDNLTDRKCWAAASIWKIFDKSEADKFVPVAELRQLSGYNDTSSGAQINYILDKLIAGQTNPGADYPLKSEWVTP